VPTISRIANVAGYWWARFALPTLRVPLTARLAEGRSTVLQQKSMLHLHVEKRTTDVSKRVIAIMQEQG